MRRAHVHRHVAVPGAQPLVVVSLNTPGVSSAVSASIPTTPVLLVLLLSPTTPVVLPVIAAATPTTPLPHGPWNRRCSAVCYKLL